MNTPIVSVPCIAWRDAIGLLSSTRQTHMHTHTVYIELHVSRQTGRQGRSEQGCIDGGRDGGRGGEGRGGEGRGGEGRGGEGRGGEGRDGKGGGNFNVGILRRELASIQYIHKPSHNAPLALDTLVLQNKL